MICPGSRLNIFTILNLISPSMLDKQTLRKVASNFEKNRDLSASLAGLFGSDNNSSNEAIDLDVKIPEYYRNPYEEKQSNKKFSNNNNKPANKDSRQRNSLADNLDSITTILTQLNSLKQYNATECPIKRVDADLDQASQLLVNSTTKSCFCQQMYSLLTSSSNGAGSLFNILKPMLMGKVLFSPNIKIYEDIIKRVNSTFADFDSFGRFIGDLAQLSERLSTQINQQSSLNSIVSVLDYIQQLMQQTNGSRSTMNTRSLNKQAEFLTQLLYWAHNSIYCFELDKFVGFPDEDEAVNVGLKLIQKEAFWAAIIFEHNNTNVLELPKIVKYKIRMNSSQTHNTIFTQDRFHAYGPANCLGCNPYFTYGFIYLQDMLEKGIIEAKTNQPQSFGINTQMTPYPCYVNDKFIMAVSRSLPLFMVLAWIYTVSMMVKDIVYEKEKRLKEFMRVMGLSNVTHWLTWFITSFVVMFAVTILLSLVLKYGKITQYSEFTVLLTFFACFTCATITQCFLISVFFNRANLAAVVAGIIYFLLYLPYTVLLNYADVVQPYHKFIASLSSTVAFSYGCEIIATFELQTKGVQWDNFYTSPYNKYDGFSMNAICLILLMDSAIYMLLTWYIEIVAPGEYGIPKPWYFPMSPYYWCGYKTKWVSLKQFRPNSKWFSFVQNLLFDSKQKFIEEEDLRDEQLIQNSRVKHRLTDAFETVDASLKAGIEINKLHKVYSRGNNHALKGLSLNFYENEISAFLGHNGAGKSSTMHCKY